MTSTWTPKPQPNSTSLWYIENEHGHVVQDALSERFAKQVCDMRAALEQVWNRGRGGEVYSGRPDDHQSCSWVKNYRAVESAINPPPANSHLT